VELALGPEEAAACGLDALHRVRHARDRLVGLGSGQELDRVPALRDVGVGLVDRDAEADRGAVVAAVDRLDAVGRIVVVRWVEMRLDAAHELLLHVGEGVLDCGVRIAHGQLRIDASGAPPQQVTVHPMTRISSAS
jgi:hypothetical protein